MMKKKSMILAALILFLSFCANSAVLSTGPWRFELQTNHGTVPFIIEFKKKGNNYSGLLKNGKESIKLSKIEIINKSVSIPLQPYDVTLEMEQPKKGQMTGFLVRHNKNPKVKTPVTAIFGQTERFPGIKSKPSIDLNGRWAVTLVDEQNKVETGVVVFEQKDNSLNGSILTPTGDYRYMEGYIAGQDFELASFDGVYNYLFKGKVTEDWKLEGRILSSHLVKIEGVRNRKAEIPDAYKQTQVESINFEFPDLLGNKISLKNFKNKPVIIQLFGSWCPNCLDEMNYLIPWYKENKSRSIEIIALAFERSLDRDEAKARLAKIHKKKKIPYTLLIAGSTAEEKPKDLLPGLKNFIAFPTLIFLNKEHQVIKVHAGFTGPSTGEFYEEWKKEFNKTVNEILK